MPVVRWVSPASGRRRAQFARVSSAASRRRAGIGLEKASIRSCATASKSSGHRNWGRAATASSTNGPSRNTVAGYSAFTSKLLSDFDPCVKVQLVGGRSRVGGSSSAAFSVARKPHLELAHDGSGNLALERENVDQVPVEALRPHLPVVRGVDELNRKVNPVADPLHAAFQQISDAERASDFVVRAAVWPGRRNRGRSCVR